MLDTLQRPTSVDVWCPADGVHFISVGYIDSIYRVHGGDKDRGNTIYIGSTISLLSSYTLTTFWPSLSSLSYLSSSPSCRHGRHLYMGYWDILYGGIPIYAWA